LAVRDLSIFARENVECHGYNLLRGKALVKFVEDNCTDRKFSLVLAVGQAFKGAFALTNSVK
jgi:hypothetical protein